MKDYKTTRLKRETSLKNYYKRKCNRYDKLLDFNEDFIEYLCDLCNWNDERIYTLRADITAYRFLLWFIIIFLLGFITYLKLKT